MNLSQDSVWHEGIYQIEFTDLVGGGPDGKANLQPKQLGDRTLWLKNQLYIQKQIAGVENYPLAVGAANVVLDNTAIGKMHRFVFDPNAKGVCILPDVAGMPDGTLIHFVVYGVAFSHLKVRPYNTQLFDFGVYTDTEICVYNNEKITLVLYNGRWEIIHCRGNFFNAGETSLQYKNSPNSLVTNGASLVRDDVSRLWKFANSLNSGGYTVLVSEDVWQIGIQYQSLFSSGNTTTTFRIPDERGMFQRAIDLGRGVDFGRQYPYGPGSYEEMDIQSHNHPIVDPPNANSQGGWGKITTGSDAKEGVIQTFYTANTGGLETRPKSVGKIPQILF